MRLSDKARIHCAPWVLGVLERKVQAFASGDFSRWAADWHVEGQLTAPGVVVPYARLEETIRQFHLDFDELDAELTFAFSSADERCLAFEWIWSVTRRQDGMRSATPDGIIMEFENRKILSVREYFDPRQSVS